MKTTIYQVIETIMVDNELEKRIITTTINKDKAKQEYDKVVAEIQNDDNFTFKEQLANDTPSIDIADEWGNLYNLEIKENEIETMPQEILNIIEYKDIIKIRLVDILQSYYDIEITDEMADKLYSTYLKLNNIENEYEMIGLIHANARNLNDSNDLEEILNGLKSV